jgi:hypothetical protein
MCFFMEATEKATSFRAKFLASASDLRFFVITYGSRYAKLTAQFRQRIVSLR